MNYVEGPLFSSSALSFIGKVHIGAGALLDINLIWFGHIARLSQWGGGDILLGQKISTCLRYAKKKSRSTESSSLRGICASNYIAYKSYCCFCFWGLFSSLQNNVQNWPKGEVAWFSAQINTYKALLKNQFSQIQIELTIGEKLINSLVNFSYHSTNVIITYRIQVSENYSF